MPAAAGTDTVSPGKNVALFAAAFVDLSSQTTYHLGLVKGKRKYVVTIDSMVSSAGGVTGACIVECG